MPRVLETILTGTNRLSPMLREAARDVEAFNRAVSGSNSRQAGSSRDLADSQRQSGTRIAEANRRIRESYGQTSQDVDRYNRQTQKSTEDTTAQVKVSAEEMSRQLTLARARLQDLGQNKVKTTVDTVDARMQLAQLRGQLDALGQAEASPRVRAETEAAQAQLRAVQAQLNRIDGQSVSATVDVDDRGSVQRSTSGMRTLTAAALTVSPALTSIGAVAVAGIGAIGPLAVAGAAGLGVLALSVVGVADAVKLIGQRQDQVALEAGKAAGAAGASAASQASAARQVASAEASLSNTRANAAESAIRAAEQVTKAQQGVARAEEQAASDVDRALDGQADAERDLTRAQRDQRQAQDDLTQARKTAQQQIEDLTGNVADNALSQRQSVLDVADAQRALNKVMADPSATQEQREQAEITYRQQLRRQESLTVQGRRLADQQAESTARGVEGSAVVAAAQQRLVNATERVQDSTRAAGDAAAEVDDARIEGARRVADAQSQVTAAVRDQASEARQAAFSVAQGQAGVASAMAAAASASAGAGSAMSDTLARIDQQLAEVNPATLEFAGYVQDRLRPAWERLKATAAGGFLPGVQQGIENLMPYLPELDGFVGRLSGRFGELTVEASEALTSPFWQDFFRMIDRNADPILSNFVRTLEHTAGGFAGMITAFMPMARDVGDGIEGLSEDFERWGQSLGDSEGFRRFTSYVRENWPKIREIVGNVAQTVGALVEAGLPIGSAYLTGFQLLTEVLSGLPVGVVQALLVAFLGYRALTSVTTILDRFGISLDTVGRNAQSVGRHAADSVTGLSRMQGAASGVLGVLGGPWGIALAAGSVLVTTFMADLQAASAQTDAWAQALYRGGDAAVQARAQYQQQRADQTGFEWMKDLDEWTGLAPSLDDAERAAGALWRQMTPLQQAQQKAAEWADTLNRRLNTQGASARDTTIAQERFAYWTGEVSRQQEQLTGVSDGVTGALAAQHRTLDQLTGAVVSTAEAESDFYDAVSRADGALTGLNGTVLDGAGNLNVQSESGRRAQDVLFGVRDSANRLIDTMVAQGATAQDVNRRDAELRESFIQTGTQMGLSRDAAERLATQIYGIPSERQTTINADVLAARIALGELQRDIDGIRGRSVVVTVATRGSIRSIEGATGAATGGYISGPGSGTSDSIPVNLSNGEYVIKASRVRELGVETLHDINEGRRGFAAGGLIGDIEVVANIDDAAFMRAVNAGTIGDGTLGGDRVSGGWRELFAAVKAEIPQARVNSSYRPGDPGYHGRDMAVDFGFGTGPGGAGSAGLAAINRLIFDRYGSNMLELIYDGIGDDRPDLKNMQPHTYNEKTRKEHANHVHAVPREDGGPVWPGQDFLIGERGREVVNFDRAGTVYPNGQATRLLTPAAGMPGYGPAGTGGALPSAADIAREIWTQAPPTFGLASLLNIGTYQESPEGPRDLAQELAYTARTRGW